MKRLFDKKLCKRNLKQILSVVLIMIVLLTSLRLEAFIVNADEAESYVTLYLVDNTTEKWVGNDSAVVELVDNTNGHGSYIMTKVDDTTWSASVPESAYNITFNRYNSEKTTQWNSWSAGGRDANNAYYVDGAEYGHWGQKEDDENCFQVGDEVYLDVSEYVNWEESDALMYVNFTNATKDDNEGNDVTIANANSMYYSPDTMDEEVEEYVYKYTITEDEAGSSTLRFWRGNSTTLWNNSVELNYDTYCQGKNCVKVTGWNDSGYVCIYTESKFEDIDKSSDTDNDGVLDYIEAIFDMDKMKEDTDGDGLSDYTEIYESSTDPILTDSDSDEISDGEEDTDGDGLNNLEEVQLGTNTGEEDTDGDGLNDYDEVYVYKTDPLVYDTDGDEVSDGKEIELGTDLLTKSDTFNISVEADEVDTVKVSVDIELTGSQVDSLTVEKYEDEFLFPETMPGYIGGIYDFSVDGTFDEAILKFEFDDSLLNDSSFDPVIFYYNEDEQELEALNTTVQGNIASAKTTHFSKYILLNRTVYEDSFTWQDVWSTEGYTSVEVVLVIDDSGSMTSNDNYNQRLTVAQELVDKLPDNSKIGVVKFASYTSILTSILTEDKSEANKYLTTTYFKSSGYTYMYEAINSAFSLFESEEDSTLKMMVVLSDGITFDTSLHSSVVKTANNNNVRIYTVGLGTDNTTYFNEYLSPLANSTGAEFYLAANASELSSIYKDINNRIDMILGSKAPYSTLKSSYIL